MAGEAGTVELIGKVFLATALLSSTGGAMACSHPEIPLTPQQEAASKRVDLRVRDRSPKQSMVVVYDPRVKANPDPLVLGAKAAVNILEISQWTQMSAADRKRYRDDPFFAHRDWWQAHKADRRKDGAATYQRFWREVSPIWEPVAFGHAYIPSPCGPVWSQKRLPIDRKLTAAPRQKDGTVIAKVYGYKLLDRPREWRQQFVVLSFQVCRGPFTSSGHCI